MEVRKHKQERVVVVGGAVGKIRADVSGVNVLVPLPLLGHVALVMMAFRQNHHLLHAHGVLVLEAQILLVINPAVLANPVRKVVPGDFVALDQQNLTAINLADLAKPVRKVVRAVLVAAEPQNLTAINLADLAKPVLIVVRAVLVADPLQLPVVLVQALGVAEHAAMAPKQEVAQINVLVSGVLMEVALEIQLPVVLVQALGVAEHAEPKQEVAQTNVLVSGVVGVHARGIVIARSVLMGLLDRVDNAETELRHAPAVHGALALAIHPLTVIKLADLAKPVLIVVPGDFVALDQQNLPATNLADLAKPVLIVVRAVLVADPLQLPVVLVQALGVAEHAELKQEVAQTNVLVNGVLMVHARGIVIVASPVLARVVGAVLLAEFLVVEHKPEYAIAEHGLGGGIALFLLAAGRFSGTSGLTLQGNADKENRVGLYVFARNLIK